MRRATGDELDARTLYALLKLRAEVFIAEQQSPWLDVDGRDLDASTVHLWLPDDAAPGGSGGAVVAALRDAGWAGPDPDRWLAPEIETAVRLVTTGEIVEVAERAIGEPLR